MRRGFKSQAEDIACKLRAELGLRSESPLPAKELLAHLEVLVIHPRDVPGLRAEVIHEMLNGSSDYWSGVTIYDPWGKPFIIHNSSHAPTRQESDLMHEAAHILCKHPPGKIVRIGELSLRSYNEDHEEEAKWLGGCLQITRRGLLWAIGRDMTIEEIADHFGASQALARYRRNVTGADTQITRFRQASGF